MMRSLDEAQRNVLAEKLADFGNIAAGSLIFGSIVSERILTVVSVLIGILLFVTSYVFALFLSRNRRT